MADKKTIGVIGILGLLGLLAFSRSAKAADVVINDDNLPPPPPDDDFSHIPVGKRLKCNYVGCNEVIPNAKTFVWQHQDVYPTPASLVNALRILGYTVDPARSIVSLINFNAAKQFQRDYNVARVAQTVTNPKPVGLATDGLVGNMTIAAIINANSWVATLGLGWQDIVALG